MIVSYEVCQMTILPLVDNLVVLLEKYDSSVSMFAFNCQLIIMYELLWGVKGGFIVWLVIDKEVTQVANVTSQIQVGPFRLGLGTTFGGIKAKIYQLLGFKLLKMKMLI